MRLSTINFIFLFSFVALSLSSCFTPQRILQVEAETSENIRWNYGRQVIRLQSDSIEAEIFFDTHTKKYLVFDVEVTNWSSRDILVSPEEIYLHWGENDPKIPALDPELEIFGKKMKASKQEAAAKNLAVIAGVAAVATVVAVAAATNDSGNNNNQENNNNFSTVTFVSTDVVPPPPSTYLPPDMAFWEELSLRKTTLAKGYKVGGKVVFPRVDGYPYFNVSIPADGRVLTAHFKQRVFQP